jgi:cytochrome c553
MSAIRPILAAMALCAALSACKVQQEAKAPEAKPGADNGTQVRNATGGMIPDRSYRSPEERIYVEKCGMCHRAMGMGTVILARRMKPEVAMLEKRDDLTETYVTQAARSGIGNMPRIPRGELSDQQLAAIARYLAKGRK